MCIHARWSETALKDGDMDGWMDGWKEGREKEKNKEKEKKHKKYKMNSYICDINT